MQRLWLLSRMKLKKALPLVKSGCDRFDPRGSIEALLAVLFGRSSRCFLGDPRGVLGAWRSHLVRVFVTSRVCSARSRGV